MTYVFVSRNLRQRDDPLNGLPSTFMRRPFVYAVIIVASRNRNIEAKGAYSLAYSIQDMHHRFARPILRILRASELLVPEDD